MSHQLRSSNAEVLITVDAFAQEALQGAREAGDVTVFVVSTDRIPIYPEDITLAVLPFFHVYGMTSVLNICVRAGSTMVLLPRFDASTALDLIEKHQVTRFSAVPTVLEGYGLSESTSSVSVNVSRDERPPRPARSSSGGWPSRSAPDPSHCLEHHEGPRLRSGAFMIRGPGSPPSDQMLYSGAAQTTTSGCS